MAGLNVASTTNVGRKSPGTIASPATLDFPPLTKAEIEYLSTRAAIPYRDANLKDDADTMIERRQQEQLSSTTVIFDSWIY